MSTDTDLTRIELLSTEDDERYQVRDPIEIRHLLSTLVTRRALITARQNPGNQSFLTALLAVNNDGTLLLDGSAEETINEWVQTAAQLTCITQLQNVRIQFNVNTPARIAYEGRPAFRTALPGSVLRLQRREFYRLQTPVTQTVNCIIPLSTTTGTQVTVSVRIIDISGGGVAVAVPPREMEFAPHMEFPGCTLHLPDVEPISTRLVVRNVFRLVNRNGVEMLRAGCQFLDLPGHADSQIQRYILKIERERNARERGNY